MQMRRNSFLWALLIGALACAADGGFHHLCAEPQAIRAVVSGERLQGVGFRALIQKLAIRYNLAGNVVNGADGTVSVTLQGDDVRIRKALDAIRKGRKASSSGNTIEQRSIGLDPALRTFTLTAWTSVSRSITTPYDLVFHLRSADDEVSRKSAKRTWNDIALATLKGDDRSRFQAHLDDIDE